MNLVLEDFDSSVRHLVTAYDANLYADLPRQQFHAGVLGIGRVLFELFVPYDFLVSARYGPHHVGIEYQADVDDVREVLASRGIGIVRDIGIALHTRPADCHGVSLEFYGNFFHDAEERTGWDPMKPPEYWRDEHPLGLTGLNGCTILLTDERACEFFFDLLDGEVVYDSVRPDVAAHAIGYKVADAVLEFLIPDGTGTVQTELRHRGEGIHSTVFGVRSADQARGYLIERGLTTVPGTVPGSVAVPPSENRGIWFEFRE